MASIRSHLRGRKVTLIGSGPLSGFELVGELVTINGSIARELSSRPVMHFVDAGAISEGLDPSSGHFGEYVAKAISAGLQGTPWLVVIRSNQLRTPKLRIPGVRVLKISVRKSRRILRKVTRTRLSGSFPDLRPSTGVMALALLEYWGVCNVHLEGFSMFSEAVTKGHFYDNPMTGSQPRNHSQADAFVIAAIQANLKNISSNDSGLNPLLHNWHAQPRWAVKSLKNDFLFSEWSPW